MRRMIPHKRGGESARIPVSTLADTARRLYADGPALHRGMMGLRPYICPFDRLVELVPEGASILDIGCGHGLFLGLLAATGRTHRGVGVDVSETAIPTARTMARGLAEARVACDLRFERVRPGDPWPDEAYDVVALIDVMHHVGRESQAGMFRAAAGAVRPGGLLLFKDVGPRPRWRAWMNRLHDLLVAREWVSLVAAPVVEGWGRDSGLELLRRERINRLWYGHDLLLFRRPA